MEIYCKGFFFHDYSQKALSQESVHVKNKMIYIVLCHDMLACCGRSDRAWEAAIGPETTKGCCVFPYPLFLSRGVATI